MRRLWALFVFRIILKFKSSDFAFSGSFYHNFGSLDYTHGELEVCATKNLLLQNPRPVHLRYNNFFFRFVCNFNSYIHIAFISFPNLSYLLLC